MTAGSNKSQIKSCSVEEASGDHVVGPALDDELAINDPSRHRGRSRTLVLFRSLLHLCPQTVFRNRHSAPAKSLDMAKPC